MGDHSGHHHHHHHSSTDNLRLAFFLNLAFAIFEIFGGLMTNSIAILADALHDLGDSMALGMSWYLEKKSKTKADKEFSFGYRRLSLLGALTSALVLIVGGFVILYHAIPRLIAPSPTHSDMMIVFALIGVLVNGFAAWRLQSGGSTHEKVVSLHLIEDVMGWVAVLIASIIMYFTGWYILDPIISILIVLWVLYNVWGHFSRTLKLFLQAVPEGMDIEKLKSEIDTVTNVVSCHHLHLWSLDGDSHVMSMHLVVKPGLDRGGVASVREQTKSMLKEKGISHITIEVEYEGEPCLDQSDNCLE